MFAVVSDPIGSGFAASLAHPGGNITGFTNLDPAMGGKWVELLKEIAPRTVRAALLFKPAVAGLIQVFMPSIQAAASSFSVQVTTAPVDTKEEIEGVIAEQARDPGGVANRELIVALAARYGFAVSDFDRIGFELKNAGALLSLSHFQHGSREVDVSHDSQSVDVRHSLAQKFNLLASEIGRLDRQPSDVSDRPRQARYQSGGERISRQREHLH